jgi:hypothetical protein
VNNDDEALSNTTCPFCSDPGSCEHLLLLADLTFRVVEGGMLEDSFGMRLRAIAEQGAGQEGFDEDEAFDDLVAEAAALGDAKQTRYNDGLPGMSSAYLCVYARSTEKADAVLRKFSTDTQLKA